ncbi:MAG: alpha/beta hydrolase [Deltaproteobacteria bacterium]|nr:alpha/beta hydrolase [Deltaproteobacteria bacterium]
MKNKIFFIIPIIIIFSISNTQGQSVPAKDTIILVHGLGRTAKSMFFLKERFEKAGYSVIAESYPSTKKPIQEHAEWLQAVIDQAPKGRSGKVHFVSHSLGGIIIRYLFNSHKPERLGRVVMLSPPNSGSEIVEFLEDSELFHRLMGPSVQVLGTDDESVPKSLGPVNFEVGIITGDASLNPFTSLLIPGEDDGKVSIESARVQGMKDFLVVHKSHTWIMDSPEVAEQIIHFIRNGEFVHKNTLH